MILLDTHIWVRWVNGDLPTKHEKCITARQTERLLIIHNMLEFYECE